MLGQVMKDKSLRTTSKTNSIFKDVPDFEGNAKYSLKLAAPRKYRYVESKKIATDMHAGVTKINGMKVTEEWLGLYIHGEDGMRTCKTCGFFSDGYAQHFCIDDRS